MIASKFFLSKNLKNEKRERKEMRKERVYKEDVEARFVWKQKSVWVFSSSKKVNEK